MTLAAGARLGPYEVMGPLGSGGMGEVLRARDARLSREVAVKILPAEVAADPSRLKRFEKEARAASALNHPNIVTIYDIGSESSLSYIAMEMVAGKTLRELLFVGGLPIKRLLQLASQIAEGLARAHEAGIVHRDLKPENVMVTKDGLVKILDFGLAKQVGPVSGSDEGSHLPTETGTSPGVVLGTVGYMSPEQAGGQLVDFRSDQFSFGSILYEMATGKRAFQKGTAVDTLSAILHEEPKPVGELNAQAPAPLRWIVERCLAKEPEQRYASTTDLARDLATMRDRLSETASGEAPLPAPAPWPLRAPWLALGLALVTAAVAAGWLVRGRLAAPSSVPAFTRLTFRQGYGNFARFAPDGQTIVYGWRSRGDPQTRLYRTQVGSPEYTKFDFDGDILAISPSNELAILQIAKGPDGTLARVQMSGGTPRQVLENVLYGGADFAPDGKDLVVAHVVDGKRRLEFPIGNVLSISGKYPDMPRFSRDGRLIAFWEDVEAGAWSLSIIGRDGSGRRVLSGGWSKAFGAPCWSAEGREIWFTAAERRDLRTSLWAVDLSGRRRLLMRIPGDLELDDVAKDGRALFEHIMPSYSVRFATASDPSERELSWLDDSFVADLSPDGKAILLNERGEGAGGSSVIYLRGTDGSPAVRLGEGEGFALSPDGKWVLAKNLPAVGKPSTLFLLPTGAGQPVELARVDFADYSFGGVLGSTAYAWGSFLPDGKRVVYSAKAKDGSSRAYVQAISGGKPQPIGPDGLSLPSGSNPVSQDGKYLVGHRDGKALLVSLDGSGPDRVLPGLSPPAEKILQWSKDARSLYVARTLAERPHKVWLYDIATGQRRLWKEFPFDAEVNEFGVRMTPGGDAWTIVSGRISTQFYLVEGLR